MIKSNNNENMTIALEVMSNCDIQKSFDKAYEKVAPFIMQGEKLTEIDRKGLMEMKKDGGAVGLNEGGDGFFEKVKQQFFKGQEYPYEVASEKPIDRGFIEDIEKATPEQTIAFGEALQLQGLDDYIDNTISQRAETIENKRLLARRILIILFVI